MLPPIVDAHLHWRDPVNNPYETLSDGVDADGQRTGGEAEVYLPGDYLSDAGDQEIVGAVHVEAEWRKSDPVGETLWLHRLADSGGTQGIPIVVVGFADLADRGVEAVLEGHAAGPRTRGVRQMLNRVESRPDLCWARRDYLEDPQWRRNYGLLASHGLDFDLMCFAHQMEPFAAFSARHPDIRVHVEHGGLPWDHSADGHAAWRAGMRALAALDHIDVKISGLGNTIAEWTEDKIRDYVLESIDIFGVNRVSFGSNFPTDRQFSDMATIWGAFDRITSGFSPDERIAMFGENTLRSYRFVR